MMCREWCGKIDMKRSWVIAILILIVSLTVWLSPKKLVCPDDYASFEESSAAFDEWLIAYLETNPQASVPQMTEARKQFYIENNCTSALERFEEGERANEAIPVP